MEKIKPSLWTILWGWFVLKMLLSFCYVSTDFEVHRNWLSITYNLPIDKWYTENTSIWTLDYPPFFAWFEYGLAGVGARFLLNDTSIDGVAPANSPLGIRPESTQLHEDVSTLIFQRTTVAATDLVFIFGVFVCVRFIFDDQKNRLSTDANVPITRRPMAEYVLCLLLCCNVGLLFVDNIHFQYNGFLFGFLLLSISEVGKGNYLSAAFLFAVLLNLKHIFLYLAPAYAAYFFRNYCFFDFGDDEKKKSPDRSSIDKWIDFRLLKTFSIRNFVKLLIVGVVVFSLSFSPFIYYDQLSRVISRLFPFKRGLTHACWAPNFWALYNALDYSMAIAGKRILRNFDYQSTPGYATGLVQEFDHLLLPTIKPITTFLITVFTLIPACLLVALKKTRWDGFVNLLTLCAFSSFLFGWHVHEKAILLILIPLSLLSIIDYRYAKIFLILSTVGHFSLFPLLFQQLESPIKYSAFLIYVIGAFWGLKIVYRLPAIDRYSYFPKLPFLNYLETVYVAGLVPLELACTFIDYHPTLSKKFQFAPLMLTSIYCSLGVVYCWAILYWTFFCKELNANTYFLMKKWRK